MSRLFMLFVSCSAFVVRSLASMLGPWAILLVGLIDASAFGTPLDPVVAWHVYHDPRRTALYVLLVSTGSACGATLPYLLGRKGGEKFLLKRAGETHYRKVRALTEKFGAMALFIPAILPPPAPFKLFEFSAGVAGMRYSRFVTTVFAGRILRFSALAYLTRRIGPQVARLAPALLRFYWPVILLLGAGILCGWQILKYWARSREMTVAAGNSAEAREVASS